MANSAEHHNPFFACPKCGGDDVYLVPPSFGDAGFYICQTCEVQITPVPKPKKERA
jgi:predicted RNA-binding Zn-ribbon protein involved in translation (DUF1610 family)